MFEIEGIQRSCAELKKFFNIETRKLENLFFHEFGKEPSPYNEGEYFGEKNHYYQIAGKIDIPENWRGESLRYPLYSIYSLFR